MRARSYAGRAANAGVQQSKVQNGQTGAPLTNFSWNEKAPSLVVTSSIDTTCTVWNIDTQSAITQLIAHDREVYDVAWLPGSTDIFVSVGADGSLRAFDLRSLEHSTILYETPAPKNVPPPTASPSSSARPPTSPLLRIAFNPADSNYMSTFHMDGTDVQILDMRSPGQPVMELRAHRGQINALGWGSTTNPLLASAGTLSLAYLCVAITEAGHRRRLPAAALGSEPVHEHPVDLPKKPELGPQLPAPRRQKAHRGGPRHGVHGPQRDQQPSVVPADRGHDYALWALDRPGRVDCHRHGQINKGVEGVNAPVLNMRGRTCL